MWVNIHPSLHSPSVRAMCAPGWHVHKDLISNSTIYWMLATSIIILTLRGGHLASVTASLTAFVPAEWRQPWEDVHTSGHEYSGWMNTCFRITSWLWTLLPSVSSQTQAESRDLEDMSTCPHMSPHVLWNTDKTNTQASSALRENSS